MIEKNILRVKSASNVIEEESPAEVRERRVEGQGGRLGFWRGSKMGRHGFVVSGLAQIGDEEMRQWQRLGGRGKERGTRREFGERG